MGDYSGLSGRPLDTGSGGSKACLSVVGGVCECLMRDRQQFEHFT